MTWTTATATRPGTVTPSGDAAAVVHQADGTVAAALIDGIGHSNEVAEEATLLARVAARAAARHRGPLAGLLTATDQITEPRADDEPDPDAVAVVATVEAGDDRVRIAWVGDCRAYALIDGQLQHLTVDHNLAEQLRMCGYDGEITQRAAQWVTTTVATAAVSTVAQAWVEAPLLVLLTSDGVHDQVEPATLEALVREHADTPQALADALVVAAQPDKDGYRDDATVVVLRHGLAAELPASQRQETVIMPADQMGVGRLIDGAGRVTELWTDSQIGIPSPGCRQAWGWITNGDPRVGRGQQVRLELPDGTVLQGRGTVEVARRLGRRHLKVYLYD
ncbi:SpoIIE family protein phosphatase [Streptosporangium sp. NPDC051022]|uniref:SpoIIE family protein phosphatase n=1 Tax=Streptosporangium sp. NPDC051022 TaxID=3155752 RepID=UPI00343D2906